mmetsp:Transcript_52175/g.129981  ORF Transcript_52175/g.129981 Transcript_52175/m.129981 type:complete len:388 (-) Transcript_52175:253-1416(-)
MAPASASRLLSCGVIMGGSCTPPGCCCACCPPSRACWICIPPSDMGCCMAIPGASGCMEERGRLALLRSEGSTKTSMLGAGKSTDVVLQISNWEPTWAACWWCLGRTNMPGDCGAAMVPPLLGCDGAWGGLGGIEAMRPKFRPIISSSVLSSARPKADSVRLKPDSTRLKLTEGERSKVESRRPKADEPRRLNCELLRLLEARPMKSEKTAVVSVEEHRDGSDQQLDGTRDMKLAVLADDSTRCAGGGITRFRFGLGRCAEEGVRPMSSARGAGWGGGAMAGGFGAAGAALGWGAAAAGASSASCSLAAEPPLRGLSTHIPLLTRRQRPHGRPPSQPVLERVQARHAMPLAICRLFFLCPFSPAARPAPPRPAASWLPSPSWASVRG